MISFTSATGGTRRATAAAAAAAARCADSPQTTPIRRPQRHDKTSLIHSFRGKSGPALGGTEYRLMPSACRLIARAKLCNLQFHAS